MNAEELARALAARFLEEGNYEALEVPLGQQGGEAFATAAAEGVLDEFFQPEEGFAGLAVQSVGYTKGAERESVVIYVTRGSQKALKALPNEVDGVPVAAHVIGKLRVGPAPAKSTSPPGHFFERQGRIACGSSCAPSREQYAGTLGALLTQGNRTLALSNNHIFAACNHTPIGMPILAPATVDARPNRRAPSEICVFETMEELRSGVPGLVTPMTVDAAIAVVRDPGVVSSWQGDDTGFDTPPTLDAPHSGMKVKKVGRTTGLTLGTVEAFVPTHWMLRYTAKRFTAEVWFQDTWTIRSDDGSPFALPGDSGSLVVTEEGSAAVGVVFVVNRLGGYAVSSELSRVLAALGDPRLLSNHGV